MLCRIGSRSSYREHKENKTNLYLFAVLSGLVFFCFSDQPLQSQNFATALQWSRVIKSKRKIDEAAGRAAFGCWAEESCGGDGSAWCAACSFYCRWPFWCGAERERQTETGRASSSIKGLKLLRFLRGQVHPGSTRSVSFSTLCVHFFAFWKQQRGICLASLLWVGRLVHTPCWCLDFLASLRRRSLCFYWWNKLFFFFLGQPAHVFLLSHVIKWAASPDLFENVQILKEAWRVQEIQSEARYPRRGKTGCRTRACGKFN